MFFHVFLFCFLFLFVFEKRRMKKSCDIKRLKINCPTSIILSPNMAETGSVINILLVYKGKFDKSLFGQVLFSGSSTPIKVMISNGVLLSVIVPNDATTGPVTVLLPGCDPLTADFTVTLPIACALQPCSTQCSITCELPTNTITVGPTGMYQTIQAAINAATAGGYITVATGDYPERLTIANKNNIYLLGNGSRIMPSACSSTACPVIEIDTSTCITIDGFQIIAPANSIHGHSDTTINVVGSTVEIINNIITSDNAFPIMADLGTSIQIGGGSKVIINKNSISGYQIYGIYASGAGTCANITENKISGAITNTIGQVGIHIDNAVAVINFNTIQNNYALGGDSAGISIPQNTANTCINNNNISNNNLGIDFATPFNFVLGSLVQKNTIMNNDIGISIEGSSCGNTFIQNTIVDNTLDVLDLTTGQGTQGTNDIYLCNTCVTENVPGLCSAKSAVPPFSCP